MTRSTTNEALKLAPREVRSLQKAHDAGKRLTIEEATSLCLWYLEIELYNDRAQYAPELDTDPDFIRSAVRTPYHRAWRALTEAQWHISELTDDHPELLSVIARQKKANANRLLDLQEENLVPCGRCRECRKELTRQWTNRRATEETEAGHNPIAN